jgi:hypothetical protein
MCGPASTLLSQLRSVLRRGRRIEGKLDRLLELSLQELMMSDEVTARLEQLQAQVNAWTTQRGQELAQAKKDLADAETRGRAAQAKEDQEQAAADKKAALDKIEEIANGLVEFQASGN